MTEILIDSNVILDLFEEDSDGLNDQKRRFINTVILTQCI